MLTLTPFGYGTVQDILHRAGMPRRYVVRPHTLDEYPFAGSGMDPVILEENLVTFPMIAANWIYDMHKGRPLFEHAPNPQSLHDLILLAEEYEVEEKELHSDHQEWDMRDYLTRNAPYLLELVP